MTGIFTALPEELAPLVARATAPRRAGRQAWRARIAGEEVVLAATGEGAARAEQRAAALIDAFGLRAAIGAGVAGGLSPDLREGDVIAAREVRGGGDTFAADAGFLARASRAADRVGVVVSDGRACFTAAEKAALLEAHPGAENAGADLESSGWARAAGRAGAAFLALRVVLDPAGEDLPESVRRGWSENGVDRVAIALRAALSPREIPELLRLRRRTRRAMQRIAGILPAILREEA